MLRVDRLETPAGGRDPVLDELPVALVAAGADDPAILVLVPVEEPVLQPQPAATVGDRAPVGGRRAGSDLARGRRDGRCRGERKALGGVVDDDGREGHQGRGSRTGGEH
jgi:hypothetical protein